MAAINDPGGGGGGGGNQVATSDLGGSVIGRMGYCMINQIKPTLQKRHPMVRCFKKSKSRFLKLLGSQNFYKMGFHV